MPSVAEPSLGSRPAPGRLAVVQAFVNTFDIESGHDTLSSPAAAAAWLEQQGLLEAREPVAAEGLERMILLREAIRALLLAHGDGGSIDEAVATINGLSRGAAITVEFDPDGSSRLEASATGVDGATGKLLAAMHDAVVDGTWARLKACRNETCRWAFYDGSKNRSGSWCTMAVCGARSKSRAYRRRRAAAS